jgi:hypothetical protein
VAERFSLEAQVERLAEVVLWAARREPPREAHALQAQGRGTQGAMSASAALGAK